MKYLITNPDADWTPEYGKRYFVDFDITKVPYEYRRSVALESISYKFRQGLLERGHELKEVKTVVPAPGVIRIYFTPVNALPLIIIVAIAVAVIAGSVIVATYFGSGVQVMFKGIGEAFPAVVQLPSTLIKNTFENPLAVVAVLFGIGFFLLRR